MTTYPVPPDIASPGIVRVADSSNAAHELAINANGAAAVEDIVRYMTEQSKVFSASTGSQAGASQTSGVCIFNASTTKNILIFSIRLLNTNAGQATLQELRKVTSNPAYSNTITPVNNNFGASGGAATSAIASGCTWQASATPTGTPIDQSNTNTLSVQELLTNHRSFLLPSGVSSGLALFVSQGGTGGLWAATFSYLEY